MNFIFENLHLVRSASAGNLKKLDKQLHDLKKNIDISSNTYDL